ncbi:hypothetical protein QBK99_12955 [Corticibacterium sp. UT-5YL-CI-8]|nr:hypothetical protein [Tianweitania sp. UT-5YL-CI-8]
MILKSLRPAFVSMLAGILVAAVPLAASAESLAGKVGDRRYPAQFGQTKGPCQQAYKQYVAASGHSAYAQTHINYDAEAFFCGSFYNAPTQKAAEERALADCNSVFTKYKVKTAGRCTVYASK